MDRVELGKPRTVGQLRELLACFSDECRLAVRNAPLPTLYYFVVNGFGHVEIEIPDIDIT